jgi:hypothetical protein
MQSDFVRKERELAPATLDIHLCEDLAAQYFAFIRAT